MEKDIRHYRLGEIVASMRKIETQLREKGAQGSGIKELSFSVSLPDHIRKKLSFCISIRNKTVHQDIDISDKDFSSFQSKVEEITHYLINMSPVNNDQAGSKICEESVVEKPSKPEPKETIPVDKLKIYEEVVKKPSKSESKETTLVEEFIQASPLKKAAMVTTGILGLLAVTYFK